MPKSKRTKEQKKKSKQRTENIKADQRKRQKQFIQYMESMKNQSAPAPVTNAIDTEEANIDTGDFAL